MQQKDTVGRLQPGNLLKKCLALGVILFGCFLLRASFFTRMHISELLREINKGLVSAQYIGFERLYGKYSVVYYPRGEEDAARLVQAAAEKFFPQVAAEFRLDLKRREPVVVYRQQRELNRFFGWPADEGTMGVYWAGTIRVLSPNAWIPETDAAAVRETFFNSGPMVHEAVHLAVDYRTRGNYPRWLTEGLAQEFERRLTGFAFDPPEGPFSWYPFEALDGFDYLPDQHLAYYQSLLMVQYLYRLGGSAKIAALIEDMGRGLSFTQAMSNNFGYNITEFEAKWREWVDKDGVQAPNKIYQTKTI